MIGAVVISAMKAGLTANLDYERTFSLRAVGHKTNSISIETRTRCAGDLGLCNVMITVLRYAELWTLHGREDIAWIGLERKSFLVFQGWCQGSD